MKPVDAVKRGTFLIASPLLRDPNFVHSVVLMCEHGDDGSWGLVLNRRTDASLGELVDSISSPPALAAGVHWGGPVETSRLQVLHRLRRTFDESLDICDGVGLGLTLDDLRRVASRELLPGEALRAYVGHAGWGAGQLDAELDTGSWIVCTADERFVFDIPAETVWDHALRALGPRYETLVNVPVDPRVN
ncbi:MAG: YqgE/AlgH family protein [bacterium]